jgi:hypothetical protein
MEYVAPVVKQEMEKIPYRGQTQMRVTFKVIDMNAGRDAVFSDNGHMYYSYNAGLAYETNIPEATYATFEKGRMKADGKQIIAVESNRKDWIRQGYVSGVVCGADGAFAAPPYIAVSFVKGRLYTCPALTFAFDATTGEWPALLEVTAYRNGEPLKTVSVRPDNWMYIHYETLEDFNGLRITFRDMGRPYRRARLQYIEFGARIVFTNDELVSARQSVDIDPVMRRLGENVLEYTINNAEGFYDPGNPQGIWRFMEEQQPWAVEYGQGCVGGMDYEDAYAFNCEELAAMDCAQIYGGGFVGWMDGGQYVLEGKPQTDKLTATFRARDRIMGLEGEYVKGVYRPRGVSLYDLAVEVLEDAIYLFF